MLLACTSTDLVRFHLQVSEIQKYMQDVAAGDKIVVKVVVPRIALRALLCPFGQVAVVRKYYDALKLASSSSYMTAWHLNLIVIVKTDRRLIRMSL